MIFCRYISLLSLILLGGCANFFSIYRTLDIGSYSRDSPRAVAIDVKQRAIFSTTRVMDPETKKWVKRDVICPEASPDALSATSLGATISAMLKGVSGPGEPLSEAQMQTAIATGEAAASIGLRTQSIQLMRDGMVFNCLMFMNGAVDPGNAYNLQRRSQNFMLGLLAIEQLTGAVKADQAALAAMANAGSGSVNIDKEAAAVEAARTKQNTARTEFETGKLELQNLEEERKAQQGKYDIAKTAHDTAVKAARNNPGEATSAEVTKTQATLTSELSTLGTKQREVDQKRIAVAALEQAKSIADQQVEIAQEALEQAKSRVRAATHATTFLNASGGRSVVVTDRIAQAVENIVETVFNESGKGETCHTLSQLYATADTGSENETKIKALLKQWSCGEEVRQQVQSYKAQDTQNNQDNREKIWRLQQLLPQLY